MIKRMPYKKGNAQLIVGQTSSPFFFGKKGLKMNKYEQEKIDVGRRFIPLANDGVCQSNRR